MHLSGWPLDIDLDEFEPVSLRPQGHDIIRTWAFYTLLRTGELTGEKRGRTSSSTAWCSVPTATR